MELHAKSYLVVIEDTEVENVIVYTRIMSRNRHLIGFANKLI